MPYRTNLIYHYDGSYQGFLCCVAQCFQAKELPVDIRAQEDEQQSLFGRRDIPTRLDLAQRVERSIPRKISPQAHRLVREGFLTCLPQREMALLRFLLMGYKYGGQVVRLTTEPVVHTLEKAALALRNEAHHTLEFLRFADCGEFLAARITPKNAVLPLVAPHFCDRLPSENFMIYDETHQMGFLYRGREGRAGEFFQADQVELPPPSGEELCWQNLWKVFYRTIAVEGRRNPKLRQNLCPKRFWPLMTELEGELG
ncbi:MAG: TIGR03915 family putative DNA repair protein [Acutalibacter sp.]